MRALQAVSETASRWRESLTPARSVADDGRVSLKYDSPSCRKRTLKPNRAAKTDLRQPEILAQRPHVRLGRDVVNGLAQFHLAFADAPAVLLSIQSGVHPAVLRSAEA